MADSFQPKFVDLVRNLSTTSGTGNFVLGPAVNGFTSLATACQAGDQFYYSAIGVDKPAEREVGRGTLLGDGTVSRAPISGPKTNFSSGAKAISLIAAAEWFAELDALASSVSATGNLLISAAAPSDARSALGLGSSSTLDWDSDTSLAAASNSKLATQKAVKAYVDAKPPTGALLIASNLSDIGDASAARTNLGLASPVNVKWFGAKGDSDSTGAIGTDDTAAIQAAINAISAAGGGTLVFPDGFYRVTSLSACANLRIAGSGATLVSTATASSPTLTIGAAAPNVTIDGLRLKLAGGAASPWHLNIAGAYATLKDCVFEKDEGAGGFQGYTRWGADHFAMVNCRWSGSNGWYVEASNATIIGGRFVARTNGGDDCFTIKAIQGVVHSFRMIGGHVENHANILAIGSEVGGAGVADPSKGVRGVVVDGVSAVNVGYGVYIKPGGGSADYRGGFVNDVVLSNLVIEDMTGANMVEGIRISPGRGCTVDGVTISNVRIRGRVSGTEATGNKKVIDLLALNQGVGSAPSIRNVMIDGVHYADPYGGVANGVGGAPGYPIFNFLNVNDAFAAGNISNVRVRSLDGDGCCENGVVISGGLNGAVIIDRIRIANAVVGGVASQYGIYAASSYTLGDHMISAGGGGAFGGAGAIVPQLPRQLAASSLIGNATGTRADASAITVGGGLGFSGSSLVINSPFAITGGNVTAASLTNSSGSPTNVPLMSFSRTSNISAPTTAGAALLIVDHQSNYSLVVQNNSGAVRFSIGPNGAVAATGPITSSGGGLGYSTGAGGTVTQATSKSTGVTLSKLSGQVTMNAAALAAGAKVSFVVTNTQVAATDVVIVNVASGGTANAYRAFVTAVAAGSFTVTVENISAGSLSESPVIAFAVLKAVTA